MRIEFDSWQLALGMEWVMPSNKAEIGAEKKQRAGSYFVINSMGGQNWLGFHEAVKGKVYSGAMLVAMVTPSAVVYHPINDELAWVCAITEGMPAVGYDKILPLPEARATAIEWSNFFPNSEMVGGLSGAKVALADIFLVLDESVASKAVTRKQLALAMLASNRPSLSRYGAWLLIAAATGAAAWAALAYQDLQRKRDAEQLTLREAARLALADGLDKARAESEHQRSNAAFEARVAGERAALKTRANPASYWSALTAVRRQVPLSARGYRPQGYDCAPEACRVEWLGGGRFTSAADKLMLPNVERNLSMELKATSVFPLRARRDALPAAPAVSAEELALTLQGHVGARAPGFQVQPAAPVAVDAPRELKLPPRVIAQIGKWRVALHGGAALVQAGELMQLVSHWPVRVTGVRFQPLASSVDIEGEYLFLTE